MTTRHVWTRAELHAWNLRQRGQLELPLAWVSRDRLTIPQNHTARGHTRTGRAVGDRAEAGRMERGDGLPVIITKARSVR